jgi:hypothetical protein
LRILCLKGGRTLATAKDTELDEDYYVFNYCAKGADEPGEVGEHVVLFLRVEDDLSRISRLFETSIRTKLTPAPYVALPNKLSMKKSSDKPSHDLSR